MILTVIPVKKKRIMSMRRIRPPEMQRMVIGPPR
jgi:hypothetical protein